MIFNREFYNLSNCSDEEKQEVWKTAVKILELNELTYQEGLLFLEDIIGNQEDPFLRYALQKAIDGCDPELLALFMDRYMNESEGKELLKRAVIAEGILGLQRGDRNQTLKESLATLFGFEWANEHVLQQNPDNWKELYSHLFEAPVRSPGTSLLETAFMDVSKSVLKQLLESLDSSDLIKALAGASGNVRKIFFNALDDKYLRVIADDLDYAGDLEETVIAEAQRLILTRLLEQKS